MSPGATPELNWSKDLIRQKEKWVDDLLADGHIRIQDRVQLVLTQLVDLAVTRTTDGQLSFIILGTRLLFLHAQLQCLDVSDVQKITQVTDTLLERNGIHPNESRLSKLQVDFLRAQALIEESRRNLTGATWLATQAGAAGRRDPEAESSRHAAQEDLQRLADRMGMGDDPKWPAFGEPWDKQWRQAVESNDLSELLTAIVANSDCPRLLPTMTMALILASPGQKWFDHVRKLQRLTTRQTPDSAVRTFKHLISAVQDGYDFSRPLPLRLNQLRKAFEDSVTLETLAMETLILAGITRVLARLHQKELAALVTARLRSLSLGATRGRDEDWSGLCGDLFLRPNSDGLDAPAVSASVAVQVSQNYSLPVSTVNRLLRLGRLSGGVLRLVIELAAALPHSREKRSTKKAEAIDKLATSVFTELLRLRGPLMKVGQLLSYFQFGLPRPIRERLSELQDAPIGSQETSHCHIVLNAASDFAPVDGWEFVAAGSVSAVFRGAAPSGEIYAAKVVLPDMKQIVQADMSIVRSTRMILKLVFPQVPIDSLIDLAQSHLLQECDLGFERDAMVTFGTAIVACPGVRVPAVHASFSAPTHLITDFVAGQSVADWLHGASQESRNRVAGNLFRAFLTAALRDGLVYADPQPANLILQDETAWIVDFGAVQRMSESLRGNIARAAVAGSLDEMASVLTEIGFVSRKHGKVAVSQAVLALETTLSPLRVDRPFRIDEQFLRDDMRKNLIGNPHLERVSLPPEYFPFLRMHLGLMSLAGHFQAEINWRRLVMEVLEGLEPKAPVGADSAHSAA